MRPAIYTYDALALFYRRKGGHLVQSMRIMAGEDVHKVLEQNWSRRKGSRCVVMVKGHTMMDLPRHTFFAFSRLRQ